MVVVAGDREGFLRAIALTEGIQGALSPDGRWLAAVSRESGRYQVYVSSFPALDARWQVSVGGGNWPRWRSDGRELFYISEEHILMSVAVQTEGGFEPGPPQRLFSVPSKEVAPTYPHEYDVAAGGERFVVCQVAEHSARGSIGVIANWEALLEGR